MEFVYNRNEECSALDFYSRYSRSFPLMAIVTRGWHGEILEDTFDAEQVLLITSHTATPHVYGTVQRRDEQTSLRTMSIPLHEDILVTLVDKNFSKVGKQMQLRDVLEKHKPPIMVELTGLKTTSTKHRFMKLLSVHHLVSMQGYFVNYGKVELKQVEIPLYLSEMRLAPLTGIKGFSQTDFSKYCHNLKKGLSVETLIAKNKKRVINVYSLDSVGSETNYNVMEPMTISTIAEAFSVSISLSGDGKDLSSNEPPPVFPKPAKLYQGKASSGIGSTTQIRNSPIPEVPADYSSDSDTEQENSRLSSIPDLSNRRTIVVGNPVGNPVNTISHFSITASPPVFIKPTKSHRGESTLATGTSTNIQNRPLPVIPKEVDNSVSEPKSYKSGLSAQHSRDFGPTHIMAGGSKVLATPFTEALRSAVVKPMRRSFSDDQDRPQTIARNDHHKYLTRSDLVNLTVEDVTHWLRTLHLHEYIRKFKEQLIDGTILCRLDESILIREFNFSNTEAIRLMAFVREGHMPR